MKRRRGLLRDAAVVAAVTALLLEAILQLAAWRVRGTLAERVASSSTGPYRILCLGESTTAPSLSNPDHSWPRQLESMLNARAGGERFQVINGGVGSVSSGLILANLEANLARHKPHMVIAMIGANDERWFGAVRLRGGLAGLLWNLRSYRLLRFLYDEAVARFEAAAPEEPMAPARPLPAQDHPAAAVIAECLSFPRERAPRHYAPMERACKKAIASAPDVAEPYEALGSLYYFELKRRPEAAALWEKARALGKPAHLFLANYYYEKGDWDRAESAFKSAASVRGPWQTSPYPYLALANIYWKRGDDARAQRMYAEAVRLTGAPGARRDVEGMSFAPGKESVTAVHYRQMRAILRERGVALVAMQYPTKDIAEVKAMFDDASGVTFVSNKENFERELARRPYSEIFWDRYGRTWGHCTAFGDRLIAENVVAALAKTPSLGAIINPP